MIDSSHRRLSIARQCQLVSISRSSFYYQTKGESELNLRLIRHIDEQFLEKPYWFSPSFTDTSEKADNEPGGVSWGAGESIARSSSSRRCS